MLFNLLKHGTHLNNVKKLSSYFHYKEQSVNAILSNLSKT
jgi:hypothetical protein